jgi:hypothetical protein
MNSAKNQFVVHNILPFPKETAEGEAKGIIPRQPYQFLHQCIEKGGEGGKYFMEMYLLFAGQKYQFNFFYEYNVSEGGG